MNTPLEFVHWLKGALEFRDLDKMDPKDALTLVKGISDHLDLVFTKVTPERKAEPTTDPLVDRYKRWKDININPTLPEDFIKPFHYPLPRDYPVPPDWISTGIPSKLTIVC